MANDERATTEEARDRLLLVDDNAANLQVLREAVEPLGCKILVAKSGAVALSIVEKAVPDLVLLDIMMPEMDGYEVCRRLKDADATRHVPVIFLTALGDPAEEAKGLALGAVDYITKPINPDLVRARVRNHLELRRYQSRLEELVRQRTREVQLTQAVMIESLATLAEYRDPETGGHIKRTQNYVKALATRLKDHPRFREHLDEETIELLYRSAPLHDIGKVGVRDAVLLKDGKLTDDEFALMRKHAEMGHEALLITEQKLGKSTFLHHAREIAYTHQEKWDGSGYPRGLAGDDIPVSGRLMALADVYDALVSKRVYKPPMPHEKAVQIIVEGRGRHFDPDVVDAFLALEGVFRNIALTFADHEEERRALRGGPATPAAGAGAPRKVLLVDDNPINLEIMSSQLVSRGYLVDVAASGREALELHRPGGYDLILTDLDMPGMDGYALAAELRRREEGGTARPTPIFAITASEFDLSEAGARAHGFSGHMLKPLDPDLLERKLQGA
ncbi:MAG TPA: response regulator [Anaeromyxobacter sp.]|nr:response regulator [Anaeromyxobacter sp.]